MMRRIPCTTIVTAVLLVPGLAGAAAAQEVTRSVSGGGVAVPGWTGKVDAQAERRGMSLKDVKFAKAGDALQVTTGPATTFWNPGNKAAGDYTVKATFTEPKYMNLNDHPHPYGIMIAGNELGTAQQSYIYCAAYGNGTYIVRGFGPAPFRLAGGGDGEANAAVHKAAGPGQPVTQEIAMSVKGDKVSCSINGTQVWSDTKANVVAAGKLKSTDGVYGIRFAHNTEGSVSGLAATKP